MKSTVKQQRLALEKAYKIKDQLIAWRRDFHQNPEIAYEEKRTASIVASHLKELGLEVKTGVGKTGVVGVLKGKEDGPTVGLRADMDALPMKDAKEKEYASKVEGKAHACGHDAHTSILMGVAKLFCEQGSLQRGNIKFIFQPAEEDVGGALSMIKDNVLENDPKVDAIAGLHVDNGMPTGKVAINPGYGCAAVDSIRIKIFGKSGHAAYPHKSIDPIVIASNVITSLQQLASRQVDPLESFVFSVGKITGGSARNIIAPDVEMIGTVRTLNPELRDKIPSRMEMIIKGITEGFGATYKFDYNKGAPAIINDDVLTDLLQQTVDNVLGENHYEIINPSMGGEDFSFFTHQVPGVFFRLGTGNREKGIVYGGHHELFDIDEDALPNGVALLHSFALNYIEEN